MSVVLSNAQNRFLRGQAHGLKALMQMARVKVGQVDASSIGYMLGPRLNAAGRLESALAAYELLTTGVESEAQALAQSLEGQNRERQDLTRWTQMRAREVALTTYGDGALLFAADPEFKPGVVGLAAARLTEEFYRPAVVATRGPEETKGSCRSIPEFHITAALDQCADLLKRHGGHAAAAGFTMATDDVETLAARLKAIAQDQLGALDLRPTQRVDVDAAGLMDGVGGIVGGTVEAQPISSAIDVPTAIQPRTCRDIRARVQPDALRSGVRDVKEGTP